MTSSRPIRVAAKSVRNPIRAGTSASHLFSLTGHAPVTVTSLARAKARVAEKMGVSDWRLHDLRRTATTEMARLGIPPHVADRVLNHTSGTISGVAAVYSRFQYSDERRNALEVWGRFVEGLVHPEKQGNVVALRG